MHVKVSVPGPPSLDWTGRMTEGGSGSWDRGAAVSQELERTGEEGPGRKSHRPQWAPTLAGPERQLREPGAGRRSSAPASYLGAIVPVRCLGGPEGTLLCPQCALRVPSSCWTSHISVLSVTFFLSPLALASREAFLEGCHPQMPVCADTCPGPACMSPSGLTAASQRGGECARPGPHS